MTTVKYSDILRAAKKRISVGNPFVCNAIDDCGVGMGAQKDFLKRWIEEMLGRDETYGSWLHEHHPDRYDVYRRSGKNARAARLPWVEYMISYWEARGQ